MFQRDDGTAPPSPWHSIRAALWGVAFLTFNFAAAAQTATVELDAREAPRRVLHAHLVLPAQPGPLTLLYPKWIPGEHGPSGPLNGLVGVRFSSQGRELPWQRDPLDMYTFRLEVPAGATAVDANLDFLIAVNEGIFSAGPRCSSAPISSRCPCVRVKGRATRSTSPRTARRPWRSRRASLSRTPDCRKRREPSSARVITGTTSGSSP